MKAVTAFGSVLCELQTTDQNLPWFWAAAICTNRLLKKKKHNLGEYQLQTEQKEYNRANTDLNHSKSLQKTPQCKSITKRVCRNNTSSTYLNYSLSLYLNTSELLKEAVEHYPADTHLNHPNYLHYTSQCI